MIEEPAKYFMDNATKLISISSVITLSIAITFDVGYFFGIDINMFTFFTLSEHVLFSIQWLPLSIVLLLYGIFFVFLIYSNRREATQSSIRRYQKSMIALLLFSIAALFYIIYTVALDRDYMLALAIMLILAFCCGIIAGITILSGISYSTKLAILSLDIYTMMLVSAFSLGYALGWARTHKNFTFNYIVSTNRGDDKFRGRIIRAGDKGVLFLRAPNNEIVFLKWENLDEVSESLGGNFSIDARNKDNRD